MNKPRASVHNRPAGHADASVHGMFNAIAPRYDLLNRLLSFRRDTAWRARLARSLSPHDPRRVLDVATGTGDVLLTLARGLDSLQCGIGLDMATAMLAVGRDKMDRDQHRGILSTLAGDALHIPCADAAFDAVTIAFGIRNVHDVAGALREMYRVLRPGGQLRILEFSLPPNRFVRASYLLYFRHMLPRVGGVISGNPHAYRYLNRTVESFPYGEAFCDILRGQGFESVRAVPLTFGVATLYEAEKAHE
ncbi:MAG: bifunctional demethylmenaquinone methyltransferase/2-methoxy-6-polyprenyl-1,4-benzoquinol methylase UbiE [Nitrospiraceae bacterium]|nr:bifunctional demethylmenaquinone methyltransferase/2-methoxy-6-polyprenyl-1,4-benzoquinol methylase UbiE [Nitrospiraceae bacterium]